MVELYVYTQDGMMLLQFKERYKAERTFMDLRECPNVTQLVVSEPGKTTTLRWVR